MGTRRRTKTEPRVLVPSSRTDAILMATEMGPLPANHMYMNGTLSWWSDGP
jgi:hypothetical protein